MRDLSELNVNIGGRPVLRPSPTDAQVHEFEEEFGVTLPPEYREFLRTINGGHPELDSVMPPEGGDPIWGVNTFFQLSDDHDSFSSLWRQMRIWRPTLGANALPIAEDGGGNPLFLDLSTDPPTAMVCWHDEGFATIDIAPTFEAFIDVLAIFPDAI